MQTRYPKGVYRDLFDFYHTRWSLIGVLWVLFGGYTSLASLSLVWLAACWVVLIPGAVVLVIDTHRTTSWMRWTGRDRDRDFTRDPEH